MYPENAALATSGDFGDCDITGMPNAFLRVSAVNGVAPRSLTDLSSAIRRVPSEVNGLHAAERASALANLLLELDAVAINERNNNPAFSRIPGFMTGADGMSTLVLRAPYDIPDSHSRENFGGYVATVSLPFDPNACEPTS